jgi:heptosyltransferase-2
MSVTHIALWNPAFLGDAVLTLALARAVSAAYPFAELDIYVRAGLGPLFACQSCFSNVYEVDKKDSLLSSMRLGRKVAGRKYDLWISAHRSPRSSLIAVMSGALRRIGYSGSWHRRLAYTDVVDRKFPALHETERLLRLALPLDIQPAAAWPVLELCPQAAANAHKFFSGLPPAPVLGIHPGSVWGTKRWDTGGFAEVARRAADSGCTVIIFAGRGEEAIVDSILAKSKLSNHPQVHNLAARLSLTELAAWIARLNCYLAGDSGHMHMAWTQHVPVVTIFGPTARSLGFIPLGEMSRVVEAQNVPCRPCSLHGPQICPKKHHNCMRLIEPAVVWGQCALFLLGGALPLQTSPAGG